jgi:hypothetical protein
MSDYTITSKVNRLLQKSRQAYRIYSAMTKTAKAEHNEYSELQAVEWMNINAELVKQLSKVVEQHAVKGLTANIAKIRHSLSVDLSHAEHDLERDQNELLICAQRGDFIRSAQLSRSLISRKSFVQASQAAVHELQLITGTAPLAQSEIKYSEIKYSEIKYTEATKDIYDLHEPEVADYSAKIIDNSQRFSSALVQASDSSPRTKRKIDDSDSGLAKVIQLRR